MSVYDELSPDMQAFSRYLWKADDLMASDAIEDVRVATRRLRDDADRAIPWIENVQEGTFEGMRYRTYRPDSAAATPTVIYFHGGAWSHLDIDVYDPIMRQVAADGPVTVIGLEYPLVPEVRFPANLQACVNFTRNVMGSEPNIPIVLMGDSAGANLAMGVAIVLRDRHKIKPAGLALIYGGFDLENERESAARYGGGELPMTTAGVRASHAFYLGDDGDPANPLMSPIKADLRDLPPTFLSVASHDNLYDENIEMARQLGYAGVSVELKIYPRAIHGFLEAWSVTGSQIAKSALEDLARFAVSRGR
ncbi:alpha/beta hydrolase [Rhizobium sp. AG207R]|uniref:alpha/beta hydrolase n=1 Tax=Rhizobium sp. AG207R TaxID=2802287 RepID=UPI0022ABF515|nr:alpha/beta hydrolase [Rhizobium sp. AG207R]MCZ3374350.1 alpha/beta hydrolase [Rhizobium sp. AG207R]